MSQENPYAIHDDNIAAIDAAPDARAVFLQKTYALVFAGVLAFVATLFLSAPEMPLHGLAMTLGLNWIVTLIIYFGGFMLVRMLAHTAVGLPLYFAFTVAFGLITAPFIVAVAGLENGATIIGQASIMTALIFTGLTAYVFKSGRDFQFLHGFLWMAFFGMMGVAICAAFMGIQLGVWYSFIGAGVMAGHILYDTSNIMRRYPTTAHVHAALELFTDIVLLFWYLLQIALSFAGDD